MVFDPPKLRQLSRRLAWIVLPALLVSALAAADEPALDSGLRLRWQAPADCPDAAFVTQAALHLLGPRPEKSLATVTVDGHVSRVGTQFSVRLERHEASSARGVRVLRGSTCADVAQAAALVIALMIDPEAALRASEQAPEEEATPEPVVAPEPVAALAPEPAPPPAPSPPELPAQRATPWSTAVELGGGLLRGVLPGTALSLEGALVAKRGEERYELLLEVLPTRAARPDSQAAVGGRFSLVGGTLSACRSLLDVGVALGLCLGANAGRLHAEGFGVSNPGAGSAAYVAAQGGALVLWSPGGPWDITLQASAEVACVRPRFVLGNVGDVYQPAALALRSRLGLEYSF